MTDPTVPIPTPPPEDHAFISGRLFDGRTFRVSRYAWPQKPDDARYDLFVNDVLAVQNVGEEGVVGWLATRLARSIDNAE